jgi:hypothetical protein
MKTIINLPMLLSFSTDRLFNAIKRFKLQRELKWNLRYAQQCRDLINEESKRLDRYERRQPTIRAELRELN